VSRPYSVRFLTGSGTAVDQTYTVPSGYRAVVRHVAASSGGVAGDYVQLFVAGVTCLTYTFPVSERSRMWDVRWVAYGGEKIRVATGGSQAAVHVSGFLFAEAGARVAGAGDLAAAIAAAELELAE